MFLLFIQTVSQPFTNMNHIMGTLTTTNTVPWAVTSVYNQICLCESSIWLEFDFASQPFSEMELLTSINFVQTNKCCPFNQHIDSFRTRLNRTSFWRGQTCYSFPVSPSFQNSSDLPAYLDVAFHPALMLAEIGWNEVHSF